MVTQIDGYDVRPMIGRCVHPDNWQWAMPLVQSNWSEADFRLSSARYDGIQWAVKITVTGRTIQKGRVRVRIEFVGDGEPSTFHTGWMNQRTKAHNPPHGSGVRAVTERVNRC